MTALQYRAACAKLNINISQSARVLDINLRTAQRYASGEAIIPEIVAKLLRAMIRLGTIDV